MLKNDPPPGTRIRFVTTVRNNKAGDSATLVGPLDSYETDEPEDEFRIRLHDGSLVVVRRDQIESL